ncbi:restriction endonuclease subunit S [Psychrobacter sp. UBA3480]|uniref:restriction endonuclease subunit S n=1 Tax=Psychrobacter sp. UBA3480 TaxID=1947350 RepID=UPI0025F4C8EE|nr:restriction endonuclease subunit S [Psychrobacter sp. UBA3480]
MSDWNTYTLSQVGSIVTGNTPSTKNNAFWIGEIPFYSPADFNGSVYCENTERTVSEEALIYGRLIPKNSIMVTCIGSIGKMSISEKSGLTNQQINSLVPFENFEFKYIYYLILNNIEKFKNLAPQTTIPILNKSEFGRFAFKFHKLPEQKKIATILQSIDKNIEKTEALIAKYQLIKAGLMQDLFTRGIGADGKLRPTRDQAPELYQETQIGWIPKEWDVINLGDISDIASGITLNSKLSPDQNIVVPYLRVANVQDGYLDLTEVKEVTVSQTAISKLMLISGDVLMNEGGDFDKLGRGTVWQGEIDCCIHQNHVFRVRVDRDVLRPYFLAFWSESNFGKKYFILSSKQSTNLASINSTQLKAYPIGVPSIDEQLEIETRIKAANSRIDTLNAENKKLNKQKQGLMHDLLTGKKRVTVDEVEADHVGI